MSTINISISFAYCAEFVGMCINILPNCLDVRSMYGQENVTINDALPLKTPDAMASPA